MFAFMLLLLVYLQYAVEMRRHSQSSFNNLCAFSVQLQAGI